MPSHAELQEAFAAALTDADRPVPAGLLGPGGRPAGTRFAIYRNNVAVGLVDAIGARYPVVRALVGDDCFHGLARAFVARHKPGSAVLSSFGSAFPEFIAAEFDNLGLPYLSDLAVLEGLWLEAYHAAEAVPADLDVLATLDIDRLDRTGLALHPSLRLTASVHPVGTIWSAHKNTTPIGGSIEWMPEHVMIVRPVADVLVMLLSAGDHAFTEALAAGMSLAEAARRGDRIDPNFDFGTSLVGLVRSGAVTGLLAS